MHNTFVLTACIAELPPLRYTPAGLPALDLRLEHTSSQQEAGHERKVTVHVKAVAFGALAQRLARQAPESIWTFQGFLTTPRNSQTVVLHIQDVQQD